jgi:ATPase subunit of ABC transporter with duplicated ATPase domains
MLDRMEKIAEPTHENQVKPIILKTSSHIPGKLFELSHLEVGYADALIRIPYDITITKDDKIGILGPNGCGKTTLLRTLL